MEEVDNIIIHSLRQIGWLVATMVYCLCMPFCNFWSTVKKGADCLYFADELHF